MDQAWTSLKHLVQWKSLLLFHLLEMLLHLVSDPTVIFFKHMPESEPTPFLQTLRGYSPESPIWPLSTWRSHNLLFPMFTLWPFILMFYFHFLNFSSCKAFVSTNRTYYRQHQVVPGTNLSWFLYSIDEASRTITNRTNSRGLRTEP